MIEKAMETVNRYIQLFNKSLNGLSIYFSNQLLSIDFTIFSQEYLIYPPSYPQFGCISKYFLAYTYN